MQQEDWKQEVYHQVTTIALKARMTGVGWLRVLNLNPYREGCSLNIDCA